MAQRVLLSINDLLVDEMNPRISTPNGGQRDALRNIATDQGTKLYALAKNIVENGLSPIDTSLVIPQEGDRKRYIVLEGNRRLTALKALESPDLFDGAIAESILRKLRALSRRFLQDPIDDIECVVLPSRELANHWIELRHTGQNEGAGIVAWGANETSRFRARQGKQEPYRNLLDRLVKDKYLEQESVDALKLTNFRRLVDSPVIRERVGLELKDKVLRLRASWPSVAKSLAFIVNDLNDRNVSVGDIYTIKQRRNYSRRVPQVKLTITTGKGPTVDGLPAMPSTGSASSRRRRPAAGRKHLIPRDATLSVTDVRIQLIESELRKLDLESFSNAVSVLFRVFLELSVDHFIDNENLNLPADPKLRAKVKLVADHLVASKKLTKDQARPVRAATQSGDSYLAASVTTMNDYVHNANMSPSPTDLRASWNNFQPFLAAIWST